MQSSWHDEAESAKTQGEHDYIEALAFFYRDYDKVDNEKPIESYSRAMERVYQQYPRDQQATVFYAPSLLAWDVDHAHLANPKKAIAILNQVLEENPDDPGATHYSMHASDAPQLAQVGLPAARRYAQIAPAAPHALRMPSRVFARLGLWRQDIQSTLSSLRPFLVASTIASDWITASCAAFITACQIARLPFVDSVTRLRSRELPFQNATLLPNPTDCYSGSLSHHAKSGRRA
jgi:hypothetical protein